MDSLDFLEHVYGIFGFTFELNLSTRPESRLGSDELWDAAEAALENALNKFGKPWVLNPGLRRSETSTPMWNDSSRFPASN